MLATLAQFKTRYTIAGAGQDALLTQILTGVSGQLAGYAGRVRDGLSCIERGAFVHYLDVPDRHQVTLWLPAWPVVAISEIKMSLFEDWASATALTVLADYQVDAGTGRLDAVGWWLKGSRTVKATYVAGYTVGVDEWVAGTAYLKDAYVQHLGLIYKAKVNHTSTLLPPLDTTNWTVQAGEQALPREIEEACLQQAGFTFQRRERLGLASESVQGGSISAYAQDDLLPGVKAIMDRYRRLIG